MIYTHLSKDREKIFKSNTNKTNKSGIRRPKNLESIRRKQSSRDQTVPRTLDVVLYTDHTEKPREPTGLNTTES